MPVSTSLPKILTLPGPILSTDSFSGPVKCRRVTVGFAAADVLVDAQATYQVLSVPAGTMVLTVKGRVITAFTASVTIGIGDGTSTSGWLTTTKVAPTSAETAGTYTDTQLATAGVFAGGLKYLVADTIDAIVGGASPLVGLLELLVFYVDGTCGTT